MGPGVASAAPTQSSAPSVTVVDVDSLKVSYNGSVLTSAQAQAIRAQREAAKRSFVLVYDPASASKGTAHAFDSVAQADAYGATVRAASRAAAKSTPVTRTKVAPSGWVSALALPSSCPNASNISRMYEHGSCGGSNLSFTLTDNEPNFGTYGWNNRASSLVVGSTTSGCTILVRLYPGINYTYTVANFYGTPSSATYYNFSSAQNDNFESGRSTCS
jgi:hypothetical protein